jgi:alginate O-acetyltransferase complex protein AlgI
MVFSSPGFLFAFFPCFFLLYFLLPQAWRNAFILVASIGFYVLGAGALTLVALLLVLLNWLGGLALGRLQADGGRQAKLLLGLLLAANLAPLVWYKYLLFLARLLADLSGIDLAPRIANWDIILPLGISFYVFHFLSYQLDVFKGTVKPEPRLARFAIYIFLFPHLIAGPVVRFAEVSEQLQPHKRRLRRQDIYWGMVIFVIGLSKKLLIADSLGAVVDATHRPDAILSTYAAWLGALCYSFQIYFDFSGYTDMAIGMARMMGFRFPRNFNRPYAARSITEFWQRWHMTLSRFFRDYVYIPLGGNRDGATRTYRNLMIVFVLCALWHGAAYTFLIWGVGHGLMLALERAGVIKMDRWRLGSLPVFLFATLLWIPFRAADLAQAGKMTQVMFGLNDAYPLWADANRMLADPKVIFLLLLAGGICLAGEGVFRRLQSVAMRRPALLGAACVLLFVLSGLTVVEHGFNPFIYFQF